MAEPETGCTPPRRSLNGTTALVTGGTRGIGYAVAEELAGLGAAVHTCSRNEAELKKCLKEWEVKGFVDTGSVCDASSRIETEKLMEEESSIFKRKLNILGYHGAREIRKEIRPEAVYATIHKQRF